MSIRVDSSSWIPGAIVVGNRGLGILADNIPATGDAGPSFLFNDVALPADSGKEVCGRVTSWPSAGTLVAYEDGSFEFSGAPDGTYSFAYSLLVDGASQGTGTGTLQVGSPVATFTQATSGAVFAGGASLAGAPATASFAATTADATASFSAEVVGPAVSECGFSVSLDAAVFAGSASGGGTFTGSLSDADIARIAAAVLAALNATTGTRTVGQHLQIQTAVLAGNETGAGTTHVTFTDGTAVVEADVPLPGAIGNRTNVTISV